MQMILSSDGKYYHGQSKKDGYVFVEAVMLGKLYSNWYKDHPKANEKIKAHIEELHYSANFWDMALLEGVHVLQYYLIVDIAEPHAAEEAYRVRCFDRGSTIWEYCPTQFQAQRWLALLPPRLVVTSEDSLAGVYTLPLQAVPLLWDMAVTRADEIAANQAKKLEEV